MELFLICPLVQEVGHMAQTATTLHYNRHNKDQFKAQKMVQEAESCISPDTKF